MCGIFCAISRHQHVWPSASVQTLLDARGPDASSRLAMTARESGPTNSSGVFISLCSTVLSLRGPVTVPQPFSRPGCRSTLCWNGEAWTIRGEQTLGNDTAVVYAMLQQALADVDASGVSGDLTEVPVDNISQTLSQIAGPYAFVIYDGSNHTIHFGRDFLGRRSLARKVCANGDLIISSITDGETQAHWTEIEADGWYVIHLSPNASHPPTTSVQPERWGDYVVHKIPYCRSDRISANNFSVIPSLRLNRNILACSLPLDQNSASVIKMHIILLDALVLRVLNIPESPLHDGDGCTLRRANIAILFSGGLDCTILARLTHEILPAAEPIDLLNVAFENPRIHPSTSGTDALFDCFEVCPDRKTGRASYQELREICPTREWRFVAINIPYREASQHRSNVIQLMHPHNTEMDLSIAMALYFAARGSGDFSPAREEENAAAVPYTTPARVLLSGLGADELFGGYARHTTAFRRAGFAALLDELELDVGRLGQRNLGRDDRVISHWAREVRFPYLDETLVSWAMAAGVQEKCGFGEARPDDNGSSGAWDESLALAADKKLLRCLAWRLGMKNVAKEKKRAIQFGARTAKMDTKNTRGTQQLSLS